MNNNLNEFVLPYNEVTFLFDPAYQVNLKLCDSDLEIRNERIAAHVAQKYNLIYRQGDGISTKTSELTDDLKFAHKEMSIYMHIGKIRWFGEPICVYFFTFDSTTDSL